MSSNTATPPPFTGFTDLYPKLTPFLDQVKAAQAKGATVPAKTSGQQPPLFITDMGATAYGNAGGGTTTYGSAPDPSTGQPTVQSQTDGAKQIIQKFVATLTTTQVGYLSGIGFSGSPAPAPPPTLSSQQNDVANAVYGAWDKSASAYMKNDNSTGDTEKAALKTLLGQYDTAIQTLGKTAAPKPS
jgi:hypothetical protein